jgi:mannitol/fructose-specific phosphotransferase system IIA component (Ntr-type)
MQMQFDCLCQLLIQKGVIKDKSELDDMLNSREVMEKISRGD